MGHTRLGFNAQRDLEEIKDLIVHYLRDTYIQDIEKEVYRCKKECANEQSREVELLYAFMSYMPQQKHAVCEEIIKLLTYQQVIDKVLPRLVTEEAIYSRNAPEYKKVVVIKLLLFSLLQQMEKTNP